MRRAIALFLVALASTASATAAEVRPPVNQRFAAADTQDVPQFQQHVVPLLGKLGCNGRACHGSFQGQGGFRLSLFGYDFKMDHDALTGGDNPRVDQQVPAESLMLEKPLLVQPHNGGQRFEKDSWQHRLLVRWIESGAPGVTDDSPSFERLEVTPSEIVFRKPGETALLQVTAVWSDGTREDVTPLCRFQSNDEQIAKVDETGHITAAGGGDTHLVVFYDNGVVPVPVMLPVSEFVGDKYPQVPTFNEVDRLVVSKLSKIGVVPSDVCTDTEFLRRVSLDLTGTLPTAAEVEAFVADHSSTKRARKIDELLERPAYAAWWTTRLCDYTGNNSQFLNNVGTANKAPQEWYDWIHRRVADNVPYDQLVAGIVLAVSRKPGQSFSEYCQEMSALYHPDSTEKFADRPSLPYYWARQNFRTPNDRALGFAYSFLGLRIQCAECHKHPFDQWTQTDFKQFTGFFSRVTYGQNPESRAEFNAMTEDLKLPKGNEGRKQAAQLLAQGKVLPFPELFVTANGRGERPKGNKKNARQAAPTIAKLLGDDVIELQAKEDPRVHLMNWMRDKDNPYFARAFVNRVWSNYFNVAIVEPPDDLSLANPPSNRPLLDYLAAEFINRNYDMKWLHREIVNSRTYQLSWVANDTNRLDERNFSRAIPRRIPAEVAVDAIRMATASDAIGQKLQTDMTGRAIALVSAGRNNRGGASYTLQIFGRSARESNCDCDRSSEASLLQTIYLQNDDELLTAIDRSDSWVTQVSRQLNAKSVAEARAAEASAKKRPNGNNGNRGSEKALRKRIAEFKKAGDEKRVARLERRLKELIAENKAAAAAEKSKKEVARSGAEEDTSDKSASNTVPAAPPVDVTPFVRQAYLRTLGRLPSDEELDRSRKFIETSENTAAGLRGVLWALLNTKEFIVNH